MAVDLSREDDHTLSRWRLDHNTFVLNLNLNIGAAKEPIRTHPSDLPT